MIQINYLWDSFNLFVKVETFSGDINLFGKGESLSGFNSVVDCSNEIYISLLIK